ncbi:P-type conjugative transfer protein TrbL [Helicobacter pylori]|uniref:type IV secretion system protein n=1 Tax=Helicobacter pylori TaxID=210 RepID=UPI000FDDEC21|nr:P-type conjugative transfer protein TrbL [Helicobacter pylori]RVZ43166.1 P-type conjugative transfer protein TrbL [Helicobacter pylori]
MAAPLLALPFLSNPLVLGALAVIGVGAYLYSNKQDSLIVQADGLYSEILGFFISFSSKILKGIGEPLANVIQPFGMVLGVLLILLYSFKRYQNNDLFEIKTFLMLFVFVGYLSLYHYAFKSDGSSSGNARSSFAFQNHVTEIFDTPANLLNAGISNVVKEYQTNSAREHKREHKNIDTHHSITNANISFHVRQILTSLNKLYEGFKINNGLSLKTLIAAVLLLVILGLELFLLFKIFCYVFMTYLEKIIYLSLVIFMLPLGFFQQTRGFLVSYVKKIISLTFYMPLLLLLVLFNSFALQYAIKVGGSNEIVAKFGIIVVIGISLTFIQKIPEMINAIFGTQGGLTDAKSFIYQGVQMASAGAGVIAGSLKSVGRSAFGRTLEAYKDAKSTINSTTANMRDMPGHPGVRVGVETIELPKSHRASK